MKNEAAAIACLDSVGQRLVGFAEFCVVSVQRVDLDFEFPLLRFVFLPQSTQLRLILPFNLNDRPLQLIDCTLTALTIASK